MTWQLIKTVILSKEWQLININAELIRVQHNTLESDTRFLKAAIAKGNKSSLAQINTYSPQLLSYREEPEIFLLESPIPELKSLALKRLDRGGGVWTVKIEKYDGLLNENTFIVDSIVSKLMSKNRRFSLIPVVQSIPVIKNATSLIVEANVNRVGLKIYNPESKKLDIGFSINENAVLDKISETIEEGSFYVKEIPGIGIYTGSVYAISDFTGFVNVTEFIKGEEINGTN